MNRIGNGDDLDQGIVANPDGTAWRHEAPATVSERIGIFVQGDLGVNPA